MDSASRAVQSARAVVEATGQLVAATTESPAPGVVAPLDTAIGEAKRTTDLASSAVGVVYDQLSSMFCKAESRRRVALVEELGDYLRDLRREARHVPDAARRLYESCDEVNSALAAGISKGKAVAVNEDDLDFLADTCYSRTKPAFRHAQSLLDKAFDLADEVAPPTMRETMVFEDEASFTTSLDAARRFVKHGLTQLVKLETRSAEQCRRLSEFPLASRRKEALTVGPWMRALTAHRVCQCAKQVVEASDSIHRERTILSDLNAKVEAAERIADNSMTIAPELQKAATLASVLTDLIEVFPGDNRPQKLISMQKQLMLLGDHAKQLVDAKLHSVVASLDNAEIPSSAQLSSATLGASQVISALKQYVNVKRELVTLGSEIERLDRVADVDDTGREAVCKLATGIEDRVVMNEEIPTSDRWDNVRETVCKVENRLDVAHREASDAIERCRALHEHAKLRKRLQECVVRGEDARVRASSLLDTVDDNELAHVPSIVQLKRVVGRTGPACTTARQNCQALLEIVVAPTDCSLERLLLAAQTAVDQAERLQRSLLEHVEAAGNDVSRLKEQRVAESRARLAALKARKAVLDLRLHDHEEAGHKRRRRHSPSCSPPRGRSRIDSSVVGTSAVGTSARLDASHPADVIPADGQLEALRRMAMKSLRKDLAGGSSTERPTE